MKGWKTERRRRKTSAPAPDPAQEPDNGKTDTVPPGQPQDEESCSTKPSHQQTNTPPPTPTLPDVTSFSPTAVNAPAVDLNVVDLNLDQSAQAGGCSRHPVLPITPDSHSYEMPVIGLESLRRLYGTSWQKYIDQSIDITDCCNCYHQRFKNGHCVECDHKLCPRCTGVCE